MPIVNLTTREAVQPQIPIIGKLRKGGPKTDPRRPGPDLEYWRFTSETPGVQTAFYDAYPGNPQVIEAFLPYAGVEDNWRTWQEEYDAGGLVHRCDGKTMYRWRNDDGTYQDGQKPCPYASGARKRTKDQPGCKPVGRLLLIIPALLRAGHVGFVTMETHSIHDLVSISACLIDIEQRAGRLNGILMSIMRVPRSISTPAWSEDGRAAGKRNRTVKWLVQVVPAAEWVQAQLERQRADAMLVAPDQPPPQIASSSSINWAEYGDDDEWDDAEDEEESDDDVIAPAAAISQVSQPARSEDPAQKIIERLRSQAAQDARLADEKLVKRAFGHLACLVRDRDRQKALLKRVFDIDSGKQLTNGMANALIAWIAAKPHTVDQDTGGTEFIPTGPALTQNEYAILFPPERATSGLEGERGTD